MKRILQYKIFESKINKESRVDKKIQLIKDLSTDLIDLGLSVDIDKGKNLDGQKYIGKTLDQLIIVTIHDKDSILDEDDYFENNLTDKKEISDFISKLEDYGLKCRSIRGGSDYVSIFYDKWGNRTNSTMI